MALAAAFRRQFCVARSMPVDEPEVGPKSADYSWLQEGSLVREVLSSGPDAVVEIMGEDLDLESVLLDQEKKREFVDQLYRAGLVIDFGERRNKWNAASLVPGEEGAPSVEELEALGWQKCPGEIYTPVGGGLDPYLLGRYGVGLTLAQEKWGAPEDQTAVCTALLFNPQKKVPEPEEEAPKTPEEEEKRKQEAYFWLESNASVFVRLVPEHDPLNAAERSELARRLREEEKRGGLASSGRSASDGGLNFRIYRGFGDGNLNREALIAELRGRAVPLVRLHRALHVSFAESLYSVMRRQKKVYDELRNNPNVVGGLTEEQRADWVRRYKDFMHRFNLERDEALGHIDLNKLSGLEYKEGQETKFVGADVVAALQEVAGVDRVRLMKEICPPQALEKAIRWWRVLPNAGVVSAGVLEQTRSYKRELGIRSDDSGYHTTTLREASFDQRKMELAREQDNTEDEAAWRRVLHRRRSASQEEAEQTRRMQGGLPLGAPLAKAPLFETAKEAAARHELNKGRLTVVGPDAATKADTKTRDASVRRGHLVAGSKTGLVTVENEGKTYYEVRNDEQLAEATHLGAENILVYGGRISGLDPKTKKVYVGRGGVIGRVDGETKVLAGSNGKVESLAGSARAVLKDQASVTAFENARVDAYGSAMAKLSDRATGAFHDQSSVECEGNTIANVGDDASWKAIGGENGTPIIRASDRSEGKVGSQVVVHAFGESKLYVMSAWDGVGDDGKPKTINASDGNEAVVYTHGDKVSVEGELGLASVVADGHSAIPALSGLNGGWDGAGLKDVLSALPQNAPKSKKV